MKERKKGWRDKVRKQKKGEKNDNEEEIQKERDEEKNTKCEI